MVEVCSDDSAVLHTLCAWLFLFSKAISIRKIAIQLSMPSSVPASPLMSAATMDRKSPTRRRSSGPLVASLEGPVGTLRRM